MVPFRYRKCRDASLNIWKSHNVRSAITLTELIIGSTWIQKLYSCGYAWRRNFYSDVLSWNFWDSEYKIREFPPWNAFGTTKVYGRSDNIREIHDWHQKFRVHEHLTDDLKNAQYIKQLFGTAITCRSRVSLSNHIHATTHDPLHWRSDYH